MRCLLLRPQTKIQQSCDVLSSLGVDVVGLALIDIQADSQAIGALTELDVSRNPQSVFIFTSSQAVNYANAWLDSLVSLPTPLNVWAIGKSSQQSLRRKNILAKAPHRQDSEGLLAELGMDFQGVPVYLFKGHGGRTLLFNALQKLGAQVTEINLYRRVKLAQPKATSPWQAEQIHCIIATSGELMEAAFEYLDPQWLRQTPWVVVSQRLAERARVLGIQQFFVSNGASDQALSECIHAHLEQ